jgi:Ran GTPase-activating protein (RanGAP) involved in mRNA processing and transport
MSVSNDSTVLSTIDAGRASLSLPFLKFCAQVRNNDPSILPEPGQPFKIRHSLSEKEGIKLADALLENTSVTYLELRTEKYTKNSAEAMAKYVRTSKHLQRIHWEGARSPLFRQREEIFCCFLHAFQESTSLKELGILFPVTGGKSNLALESMLTHTQSLQSLSHFYPFGLLGDIAVAAASSGLRKNTSLRELTLEFEGFASTSPIFTSVRDHPHLRRLCLRGHMSDVAGLETFLLSDTSKITELDIDRLYFLPITGSTPILQALASRPTLTKLGLHRYPLGRDDASLLCAALRNMPSLQTLDLARSHLGSAGLEELTSALYHNKSIEVLDLSLNRLDGMESAEILRDILRSNKTITALNLSGNTFGRTPGAVERIADGLGSNSTLLTINYSSCSLGDDGVTTLAQTLGSRNTTLQKLTLTWNAITSTDFGMLLETMEQSSHIADLDLCGNYFGDGGAVLLARSLGNNALPNLTQLSLCDCGISDDGFIALMSALEHNTSLIHLDLRYNYFGIIEQGAFLALAKSLPEIKVLQRIDLTWCTYLASAMPLLLAGLHKNTSLFRIHVASCAPSYVPPTTEEMAKFAGGWMQEMERLGYRNRFLPIIRAPKERLPAHGVWPRALALAATLPDVIFDVLRSKPSLVLSADREGKKAALDTGVPCKRKRGDE